jgi:2,3-bisphosphoglycerate-independent phosphoglycerate mutase
MVGHTGDLDATVRAMEVVDECVGELRRATVEARGVLIVTGDHGNADQMFDVDTRTGDFVRDAAGRRRVRTSHSLNPVPFAVFDPTCEWRVAGTTGSIAGIGPTLLDLCGLDPAPGMLPSLVRRS